MLQRPSWGSSALLGASMLLVMAAQAHAQPIPLPPPAPSSPPASTPQPTPAPQPSPTPPPAPADAALQPSPTPQPFAVQGPPAAYPSPGWGSALDSAPSEPPSEKRSEKRAGVSAGGIPLPERGGLILDVAAMKRHEGVPFSVLNIIARVPVVRGAFVDARVPTAFGALGNPTVGGHYIDQRADSLWMSGGASFGFPLAARRFDELVVARAAWDAHEWLAQYVPFKIDLGIEWHSGSFILRGEVDPIVAISIEAGRDPQFYLQHALDVQVGHSIGGGLRFQGVWLASFDGEENYQVTVEPFFAAEKDMLFARVALVLPVTEGLGPPFEEYWGFKVATGFRLE